MRLTKKVQKSPFLQSFNSFFLIVKHNCQKLQFSRNESITLEGVLPKHKTMTRTISQIKHFEKNVFSNNIFLCNLRHTISSNSDSCFSFLSCLSPFFFQNPNFSACFDRKRYISNSTTKPKNTATKEEITSFNTKFNIPWPIIIRKSYENELKKVFLDANFNYRNVWLLGTKGAGKASLVFRVHKNIADNKQTLPLSQPIVLFFDFGEMEFRNFQICISKLEESLRQQFLNQAGNRVTCEWIFKKVRSNFEDFMINFKAFLYDIQDVNSASSFHVSSSNNSVFIKQIIQKIEEKTFNEMCWKEFMCFLFKLSPLISIIQPASATNMTMYILKCIAECEENRYAHKHSKGVLRVFPTGVKTMAYFLSIFNEFIKEMHIPLSIVFLNIETLSRSVYLLDRGGIFLNSYIQLVSERFFVPTIYLTKDSLFAAKHIYFTNKILENIDKHCMPSVSSTENISEVEDKNEFLVRSITSPYLKIIQLEDFPNKLVKEILYPKFTEFEEILNGVCESFGGHCSHIEKVARALVSAKLQHEIEMKNPKKIEKNQVDDLDEAQLPSNATDEERSRFQKLEFEKDFLRNIPQTLFVEEMRSFEWKMNRFMSLEAIEQMRIEEKNIIHFYVMMLETFRYIISKPHILCANFKALRNPIVLGMVDVGVLTMRFNPCRFQIENVFTKHLLNNYIYLKYGSLSWKDRVYYNINFLLNYKAIRKQINSFSEI